MADTVRTIAELLALFADNTSGDISPQDLRDAIVTFDAKAPTVPLCATMSTDGLGTGQFYMMGHYDFPAAHKAWTNAAATQVYGVANGSYAAHANIIASGPGSTDGTDLVITVTGTSITDAGVRTVGDSEIIIADCRTSALNTMHETSKKWLGPVTFTLSSTGGTAFSFTGNYGFSSYNDLGNTDFDIDNFDFEWYGGATDSGFDVDIHVHETTGWTYHATAFAPGSPPKFRLQTDYLTDNSLINAKHGKWKRIGLSESVNGGGSEGVICHVTTTINNSLEWLNATIRVKPTS